MGNEGSRLTGLVIDKAAVETNDFWTLYHAVSNTTSNEEGQQMLSIFQGEPVVSGQLWVTNGPMERAIKNLMIYRHPYILKYVATWEQGSQKHLATERVLPLVAVSSIQSDIQICLGLRSILCSLIFLIEKAMARHLNICISSIYITDNGSWRLAGFEYVWKSKEVTKALLDLANAYRYKEAIDPSELIENNSDYIEQYAFATLCEEIFKKCSKMENVTPHVDEFRTYCANHLKHKNAQMRPKLSAVLLHPYFNHEFILIHSFLFELPLKNVQEKQDFFTGLIDRLRYFNEDVVAAQLASNLLSRMVLLDPTAQLCVTPYVLKTKAEYPAAIFSNQTYTRHLMPHIKKMFRIRDAQIRLILLEYFMEFVRLIPNHEIQEFILPHLLAGMNDTNDVLVAKTLRCLADLVPMLGAAIVIGGNRLRLFSDGRPQAAVPDSTVHWVEPRSITPVMGSDVDYMVSGSPLLDHVDLSGSCSSLPQAETSDQLEMPPRLSPDGGEDDKTAVILCGVNAPAQNETEIESTEVCESIPDILIASAVRLANLPPPPPQPVTANEDEEWSDWETDELQRLNGNAASSENNQIDSSSTNNFNSLNLITAHNTSPNLVDANSVSYITRASQISLTDSYRTAPPSNASSSQSLKPPKINDDLNALDIQVQKSIAALKEQSTGFDFFKDMEPVIESSNLIVANNIPATSARIEEDIVIDSSRFAAMPLSSGPADTNVTVEGDGWRVDDDDSVDWNA